MDLDLGPKIIPKIIKNKIKYDKNKYDKYEIIFKRTKYNTNKH